jgi:hypothetical protein
MEPSSPIHEHDVPLHETGQAPVNPIGKKEE